MRLLHSSGESGSVTVQGTDLGTGLKGDLGTGLESDVGLHSVTPFGRHSISSFPFA